MVDRLLLDCRFSFETQYFRTFKIDKDKNIEIIKFSINNLEYNESGDIIGEKQNPDITKVKVDYRIDTKGYFKKNKMDKTSIVIYLALSSILNSACKEKKYYKIKKDRRKFWIGRNHEGK